MKRVLVIIPAYNEEATVGQVVRVIQQNLIGFPSHEILVVDDGSDDETSIRANAAGAQVVRHDVNRGLGAAFKTGLDYALESRADVMVNIDADGQFSGADIPSLIAPILSGSADFAVGDRFAPRSQRPANMPWVKYIGNAMMTRLINAITGRVFTDVSSGFRAYSFEALLRLNLHGGFTYTQESFLDLATKGMRICQVPVSVRYFSHRRSRISGSVLRYALNTLLIIFRTYRDHKPLRVFGWLGGLFVASGGSGGLVVLFHFLKAQQFSPYKYLALASAYLITIGLGFWMLGLVADMIGVTRRNQEQSLYLQRRASFAKRFPPTQGRDRP